MIARVNGIDLYYVAHGRGDPVLFVHGFPLTGEMWNPTVERLSNRWSCLVPDLRGHGRSDVSDDATMAAFADDLAGLLDALGEKRPVVLVGLSMGGYIAFEFFRRHRARLRALVLADTRATADNEEARAKREATAAAVLTQGSKLVADSMIGTLFGPATSADLKAQWHAIMSRNPPRGVAAALWAMAGRADSMPLLTQIDCPTLVVVGADDAITTPAVSAEIHARIRGATLAIIPDAGHMAPVEQPETFAAELRRFLEAM